MSERATGILMPISSLPSDYGIGCFSKSAYGNTVILYTQLGKLSIAIIKNRRILCTFHFGILSTTYRRNLFFITIYGFKSYFAPRKK